VGDFLEDGVGDLVVKGAADAVDEEVGEVEADEHGQGEGTGGDIIGRGGLGGDGGVVVEESGCGGGLAEEEALAGLAEEVDPEGELVGDLM